MSGTSYRMASAGHLHDGERRVEQWVVIDVGTGEVVYGPGPEKEATRALGRLIARMAAERRKR